MSEEEYEEQPQDEGLTQEEILQLAQAMKDNVPSQDEKQNVHSFLHNVVTAEDNKKVGNLRAEENNDELGMPLHKVRGSLEMARISRLLMNNPFFEQWFIGEAEETLTTSLSQGGFLIKQATTTTKQVADATKRVKENKGWFKKTKETTGGDITSS